MNSYIKSADIDFLLAQIELCLDTYKQKISAKEKRALLEKIGTLSDQMNAELNSPKSECQLLHRMKLTAVEIFDYQIAIRENKK